MGEAVTSISRLIRNNAIFGAPKRWRNSQREIMLHGAYQSVLAAPPIVSGSVRTSMNMSNNTFTALFPVRYARTHDKSNVQCANPVMEFWNGYVVSTGAAGLTTLERGPNNAIPADAKCTYEYSILTGITGRGTDQSAATLTRATFNGMLGDAAFIAAGGAVRNDGYTIDVPENFTFRTDPFSLALAAGEHYFHQMKVKGLDTQRYPINITSHGAGVGDLLYNAAAEAGPGATGDLIVSKNWVGVTSPNQFGGSFAPIMVLGTGLAGTKVVGVEGDSIIREVTGSATLALTSTDLGDADGVQCFAKRALNAAGYSYIDVSVSGTNAKDIRAGMPSARRAYGLQYCSAVITDMLHNDRATGRTFLSTNGLGTLYAWHNDWLRSKIKAGGRVIRTTLSPATNSTVAISALTSVGTTATATTASTATLTTGQTVAIAGATGGTTAYNGSYVVTVTDATHFTYTFAGTSGVAATGTLTWADGWATAANQTPKNGDATYPSISEAALTGGQFTLADKIMRRGAYAAVPYGGVGECDAGFDLYSYVGDASGLYQVDGTRYYGTDDGTHPKPALQIAAAAGLQPLLPELLGF